MKFFRKGKNTNYVLLDKHAFFVPGLGGTFALLGWFGLGMAISLTFGVFIGLLMQLLGLGIDTVNPNEISDIGVEYLQLILYPIMFIPVYFWASRKSEHAYFNGQDGYLLDSNNFGKFNYWVVAAICTVGTLGLAFIMDGLSGLILPDMSSEMDNALRNLVEGDFIICFLSVSVLAPILEEWFVRGLILRGLLNAKRKNGARLMNPWWAITISAGIFALIHMNIWQAFPAFTLGFVFGIIYYKTGSLRLTMLMHFVNNTFALILARVDSLKDIDAWWEVIDPTVYIALIGVATLIVAGLVVFFLRLPSAGCDPAPATDYEGKFQL